MFIRTPKGLISAEGIKTVAYTLDNLTGKGEINITYFGDESVVSIAVNDNDVKALYEEIADILCKKKK